MSKTRVGRLARCYTNQPLHVVDDLELDARSSHHLAKVLRVKQGQPVELFNGDNINYAGTITGIGKSVRVAIESVSENACESPLKITLIQCVARGDKMDTIVQKASELGVHCIRPVYSAQSIGKLDSSRQSKKLNHWQNITISACEQCGRSVLPKVMPIEKLADVLGNIDNSEIPSQRFVMTPGQAPGLSALSDIQSAAVLIGPEAGLDPIEVDMAKAAGFVQLQLGPRVMRTETAGPAAITVLQTRFGDM